MNRNRPWPEKGRERVVTAVLARLQRDQKRVTDPEVARFLEYLAQCFYDADFTVGGVYRACDLKEGVFVPRFQAALGKAPKRYVQSLRMSVAAELLTETDDSIEVIAELIGMKAGSAFSHAFLKATGERPSKHRSRLKKSHAGSKLFGLDLGRRIQQTELEPREVESLMRRLQADYPDVTGSATRPTFYPGETAPPGHLAREDLEWLNAEMLWFDIQDLPEEEQRSHIQQQAASSTSILCEFLRQKSLEIGRESRPRGLRIARLALDAAIAVEALDDSGYSNLQARAWAWLGNAQRLNFQLEEAGRSFSMADGFLPAEAGPLAQGEVLQLKASLCWYRNEIQAGIELDSRSILLLQEAADKENLAAAFSQRGILYFLAGKHEEAIKDYTRVLDLLVDSSSGHQAQAATYNLAVCNWYMGDTQAAKEAASELKRQLVKTESEFLLAELQRFEGRIAITEEKFDLAVVILTEVRSKLKLIDSNLVALVNLDLAIALFQKKQAIRSLRLLRESLPVIRLFSDLPGFEHAFKNFERATRSGLISCKEIVKVRNFCDKCERTPINKAPLMLEGIL